MRLAHPLAEGTQRQQLAGVEQLTPLANAVAAPDTVKLLPMDGTIGSSGIQLSPNAHGEGRGARLCAPTSSCRAASALWKAAWSWGAAMR
jgi:hypothetical protein